MKPNPFVIAVLLLAAISPAAYAQHDAHQSAGEKRPAKGQYYCPMHPSYTSSKPGDCPICNMSLVRAEAESGEETPGQSAAAAPAEGSVRITPYRQQLIGVRTDTVRYRPFSKTIRTVGRVAFDPGLYAAQQEYIEAVKVYAKLSAASGRPEIVQSARSIMDAAALKLSLLGLNAAQLEQLRTTLENDESLLVSSGPGVWVYAAIFEYELADVAVGMPARVTAVAYPAREFTGELASLDSVLDSATRSVRARIRIGNGEGLLKPNMYVDVAISSDLGVRLVVPREAILDSGRRKIVLRALEDGYFQPREVVTGAVSDDYAEIVEGLDENDQVVVSGNFLIDAESKLKAALTGTGHGQH